MAKGKKAFLFDLIEAFRPWCEMLFVKIARQYTDYTIEGERIPEELRRIIIEEYKLYFISRNKPVISIMHKKLKETAQQIKKAEI